MTRRRRLVRARVEKQLLVSSQLNHKPRSEHSEYVPRRTWTKYKRNKTKRIILTNAHFAGGGGGGGGKVYSSSLPRGRIVLTHEPRRTFKWDNYFFEFGTQFPPFIRGRSREIGREEIPVHIRIHSFIVVIGIRCARSATLREIQNTYANREKSNFIARSKTNAIPSALNTPSNLLFNRHSDTRFYVA